MGRVEESKIIYAPYGAELSVRIKRKGITKYEKPIILKGKGVKNGDKR